MDPLSIATQKGEGEAVVFKSDYQDPYDVYAKERQRKDLLLAKKKADEAKVKEQRLKDLDELNKLAIEGHISYLDDLGKMKNAMIEKASDALLKSGGTADINQVIYKDLTDFKKTMDVAKQVESWASQVQQNIDKNAEKISPESIEGVKSFIKLTPTEKKDYLTKNGFPHLTPKQEMVNYDEDIAKIKVAKRKTDTDQITGAYITTTKGESIDPKDVDMLAERYVKNGTGENPRSLAAKQLLDDIKSQMSDDPNFQLLDDEEQMFAVQNKAKEYVKSGILAKESTSSGKEIKALPSKKDYSLSGNVYGSDKWRFSYDNGKVSIEDVLSPENKYYKFIVDGETKYIRPLEFDVSTEPEKKYAAYQPDDPNFNKQKVSNPDFIGEEEYVDEDGYKAYRTIRIPYDKVKGKMEAITGVSLQDVKNNFGIGPVKKSDSKIVSKGGKKVSSTVIKNLVGKKGYEGYTEKELVDYYKSQGYSIE